MPPKSITYRSLQELLLGKWDEYRVNLEDPLSYAIVPETFLESSPHLHKAIDQALMMIDTMKMCSETLGELIALFNVLFDLFNITIKDDTFGNPPNIAPAPSISGTNTLPSLSLGVNGPNSPIGADNSNSLTALLNKGPNSGPNTGLNGVPNTGLNTGPNTGPNPNLNGGPNIPQTTLNLAQTGPNFIPAPQMTPNLLQNVSFPTLDLINPPIVTSGKDQMTMNNLILDHNNANTSTFTTSQSLLSTHSGQTSPTNANIVTSHSLVTNQTIQTIQTNQTNQTTMSQYASNVFTERMQHDLIALMISVFSGLMHHLDIILAQPATSDAGLEAYKMHFVGRISDVISMVLYFFGKIALHKKKFTIMLNHLINGEIIFAAVHCVANVMTQSITTNAMKFLLDLIWNDHTTALILMQSYDILSILHIRFQLLVDIERLAYIHTEYLDPVTNLSTVLNTAELALQVKPPHEILQPKHIEPFFELLQVYQQLLAAISSNYSKGFVDDDFILELQSQVMFIIRYLQLYANQIHKIVTLQHQQSLQLQHQQSQLPSSSSSLSASNNGIANPQHGYSGSVPLLGNVTHGLVTTQNLDNIHSNNKQMVNLIDLSIPPGLIFDLSRTLFVSNASTINPPSHTPPHHNSSHHSRRQSTIPQQHQETMMVSGMALPNSTNGTQGDLFIDINSGFTTTNNPTSFGKTLNNNTPSGAAVSTDTMAMFRPILQLSVDVLQLISDMIAKHPSLIDVFLYRDIGIIPTCVKLVVIYRLERSITSFSPSVGTQ